MSYKFYQNKDCEYFPCHKNIDITEFNCLFCYCPLYLINDCLGNYEFINGIKDCSNCNTPHIKKQYDHILKVLNHNVFNK